VSQATFFSNRVPAPEGVILSFARPKESIQRKGRPDTACFLRAAVVLGAVYGIFGDAMRNINY